jgi:hypothetical protein
MKSSYDKAQLTKWINEAIREQNHFWWGSVIGMQYGKLSMKRVSEDEELSYCVNTVEDIANSFMPIVLVKLGSPYVGKGWSKTGKIIKWYSKDHEPVNVAYLRIKPEPVVYETGASSFYLNSLILFTDNTGSLIRLRDEIYEDHKDEAELKPEIFVALCDSARLTYLREADDKENWEYRYINAMRYKKCYKDVLEFCRIYANDFANWKIDHVNCNISG